MSKLMTVNWINIDDKLPHSEDDRAVFVYSKDVGFSIGKCDHLTPMNWIIFIDYDVQYVRDVTHWAEINVEVPNEL